MPTFQMDEAEGAAGGKRLPLALANRPKSLPPRPQMRIDENSRYK
jgi:hypothetical protein